MISDQETSMMDKFRVAEQQFGNQASGLQSLKEQLASLTELHIHLSSIVGTLVEKVAALEERLGER